MTADRTRKPALQPVRRRVPPPRATGRVASLPPARVIPLPGHGAEDVVVGHDGMLLCGVEGGRILRVDPATGATDVVADTGGRPLGLEVLADGRLLVCDSHRGLLRVDVTTGDVETLVRAVDGTALRFCSNAAAAPDGTIWFTESTSRFDFETYRGALLEHRPTGRLFRRDADGRVEKVLDGLYFANGVALTDRGAALVFAETGDYRVSKLWLAGPRQGRRETLCADLPGFPDNVSRLQDGRIWVAIAAPRMRLLDLLAPTPPVLRRVLWRVPERLQPPPPAAVWALAIDESGTVVAEHRGTRPDFDFVTGAAELDGRLYLASPGHDALLELDLR